jgi:phytanoyl-CoA hydroxylase
LLAGPTMVTPRLTDVPVRMPLPPAGRLGSIYETRLGATKSYFGKAA